MKKYLLLISSALLLLWSGLAISLAPSVQAVDVVGGACTGAAAESAACKDAKSVGSSNPLFGPSGLITIAIQLLNILIGVVAVIVLIIAGIRFITANGDANAVVRARATIIYAVVGLGVVALSQSIVSFVLSRIGP